MSWDNNAKVGNNAKLQDNVTSSCEEIRKNNTISFVLFLLSIVLRLRDIS